MVREREIELAGTKITCRCHVCGFFRTPEEEDNLLLPFLKDGLEQGDKAWQIIDGRLADVRYRRMTDAGIDVDASIAAGKMTIIPWQEAHLKDGRFDQYAMIQFLKDKIPLAKQMGLTTTRLWASMGWALEDFPGVHDILEYEARVNAVLPSQDLIAVCTYDVRKFSASIIIDILRTHPYVIAGGFLRENPFYVPPDQFLAELNERGRSPRIN
jgi:hypothetical protein